MASIIQTRLGESIAARFLFSAATGLLLAVSFPNAGASAAVFVAFVPLFLAQASSSSKKESFLLGWTFYTVTWLVNVPWVVNVMRNHGGISLPVGVTLYVLMALYLGLWGGLFGLIQFALRGGRERLVNWLALAIAWAALEFARAHFLGGFPWNLTATTLVDLPFAQIARWVGPYMVASFAVAPSAIIAWFLINPAAARRRLVIVVTIALIAGWAVLGSGMERLEERRIRDDVTTRVALIQPNISLQMRWNPEGVYAIFDQMASATLEASSRGADVIVWPESTVPLSFETNRFYKEWVEEVSRRDDVDIILGSVGVDISDPKKIYNSVYLVSGGEVIQRYDKIKLVPFGEFVPMRKALFFAEKLVREVGEFQFGSFEGSLDGRFRYGLAVCYEIVFPDLVATRAREGADLLVTVTNDGWFGDSAAPPQHLDMARLRAIETGRYVARAATTGITAIVDPAGSVSASLGVGELGTVYGDVASREELTPYVRFGDWFGVAAMIITVAALLRRRGRRA